MIVVICSGVALLVFEVVKSSVVVNLVFFFSGLEPYKGRDNFN